MPRRDQSNGPGVLSSMTAVVASSRRMVIVPVRRSAGCVSTAWYQPTCVMLNIRPAGRQAGPRSMKRSPRAPLRRRLKALGAAVETPRRSASVPVRRSAGCVSTAWYHPTCAMQKVRCSDRQAPDLDVTVASIRDARTAGYVRSDRNLYRTSSASRTISRQNSRGHLRVCIPYTRNECKITNILTNLRRQGAHAARSHARRAMLRTER